MRKSAKNIVKAALKVNRAGQQVKRYQMSATWHGLNIRIIPCPDQTPATHPRSLLLLFSRTLPPCIFIDFRIRFRYT